jgi:hypothetical protein
VLDDAADEVEAYWLPDIMVLPSFQIEKWQCMPDPLSPKMGFGMKVAVLP